MDIIAPIQADTGLLLLFGFVEIAGEIHLLASKILLSAGAAAVAG
jgi:hypothetical protein